MPARFSIALAALAACAFGADARIRVLVLTGHSDLPYHDWRLTTPRLRTMLEETGRFQVRIAEHVEALGADELKDSDVLLLNYNGPRWPAAIEKAIAAFVASGKGMFSFHLASYGAFYGMVFDQRWQASPTGDPGWRGYAQLIGATWDPPKIGHGRRHTFIARWVDREHPIAKGLEETFATDDELYHRLTLLPATHVLAAAYSAPQTGGTGNDEPIVWIAPFGEGRIVYTTLGHDPAALTAPGVVAAFTHGVEWAATGKVEQAVRGAANR